MEGFPVNYLCHSLLKSVILILWVEVRLGVAMELPDVDSIVLGRCDYHTIVMGIEKSLNEWICVSNKGLVVGWNILLCIIIPQFDEVVFSSGEHVASILSQVGGCDGTSVDCVKLTDVDSLKSSQRVDSDPQVLSHNDELSTIFGELEALDNLANIDLVLEDD